MGFETSGFDELAKSLSDLSDSVEKLSETDSVNFDDLFTSSFMQNHTHFSSIDEFLEAGNFPVNSQEEFESIPDEDLDKYVNSCTDFDCWQDMLDTAGSEYIESQLNF